MMWWFGQIQNTSYLGKRAINRVEFELTIRLDKTEFERMIENQLWKNDLKKLFLEGTWKIDWRPSITDWGLSIKGWGYLWESFGWD